MTITEQPKALQLAELCDNFQKLEKFGAELRRQHARIAELEAQLSAIGAGGVEPLRKSTAAPQAVQASVPVGTKFFDFDPCCDDLVVHDTAEAACAAAQQSIDLYREDAAEGWDEEVNRVCWGMILGQALETKLSEDLPPDAFSAGVAGSLPPVDYVLHAPAHPAEGVPEQAGTYAEARECEHCNHVGINDAANGIASCTACKWNGDSPKEDKCPDCEAEGTMTASCPKCHHEYRLIADATLAATQPAAQGLDAETRRHAAIGKAIERACADLPEETEIIVSLEKDAGTVTLIDQDGNEHENFSTDCGFAGVLNEAIGAAITAQAKKGNAQQ